ncbi:hypothetical protein Y717_13125 [Streptomyces scopuliridis RB72]|uniref:Uncharacterized protein n=1 Tax=Streptomyces scopuliridis RB72 TaxID=1440053 RepID=A0A2T7TF35_9ACTN|nr:hypothetical protein Y717_13125 [Streptomyces scopuliridis RB72]
MTHLITELRRTGLYILRAGFGSAPERLGGLREVLGVLQRCVQCSAPSHLFVTRERQQQCDDTYDDRHSAERKSGI